MKLWHSLSLALLIALSIAPLAAGQQFPKATEQGNKALQALLDRCAAAGGLKAVGDPKSKVKQWGVADSVKLQAAVAGQRALLTPELHDALIACWIEPDQAHMLLPVELLRVVGQESKSDRVLAYAAFYAASAEMNQRRYTAALKQYQEGARLFGALEYSAWQGSCLHQIGWIHADQDRNEQALDSYQKAATARRKPGVHPGDLGQTLHNLGLVLTALDRYDQAVEHYREALMVRRQVLREIHADVGYTLNNLGWVHYLMEKYDAAQKYYEQALALRRKLHNADHVDTAQTLHNLGLLHYYRLDYLRAHEAYHQALAMRRKLLGKSDLDTAQTLLNMGDTYYAQGSYQKARPHYEEALAMRRALLKEDHLQVATALKLAGINYSGLGEYGKGIDYCRQALAVYRRLLGNDHPSVATCLLSLGNVHLHKGEPTLARENYQQALLIFQKTPKQQQTGIAACMNNIGKIYADQGDFSNGLRHYEQAWSLLRQTFGDANPDVASCVNNIAGIYFRKGEFTRALEYYQRGLAARQKTLGEHHPDVAASWLNIGDAQHRQGAFASAAANYRRALHIMRKVHGDHHPDVASCMANLGEAYFELGDHDKALTTIQDALAIRRKILDDKHPDIAQSRHNLGMFFGERGDHDRAIQELEQAVAIWRHVHGECHVELAQSLHRIALVHFAKGDHEQTLRVSSDTIHALRKAPSGKLWSAIEEVDAADLHTLPFTVESLRWRGMVLEKSLGLAPPTAKLRSCAKTYELAASVLERVRSKGLDTAASKAFHGGESFDLFPRWIGLCKRLDAREADAGHLKSAFTIVELGTARAFLESLSQSRAHILGGVDAELRAQEVEVMTLLRIREEKLTDEQNRPPDQRNAERIAQLLDEQARLEERRSRLMERMEREYPRYKAFKYPTPCSLDEARACLQPNEIALSYLLGDEASYVVVVEPVAAKAGLAIYRLAPAAEIADKIAQLTDSETLAQPARSHAVAQEMYALLLAPLAEKIQGRDLVVVGSGALGHLPFELLRDTKSRKLLIETHRIRYAPSLTVLNLVRLWQQKRAAPDQPFWAVGDPIYDADDPRWTGRAPVSAQSKHVAQELRSREGTGKPFGRLVHSETEITEIARFLGAKRDNIRLGTSATEGQLKEDSATGRLARARFVHFASHGILGVDVGRQPSLVLSQVGDDREDGFLQLDEITNLKLNADLVVLSACRTGQGRMHRGEGVTGLARAFLYAGSKGVVCSLWSVDDRETANLMVDFYRHLKKGRPAAEALREARLAMIRAGKAPLYWAPFILIGE